MAKDRNDDPSGSIGKTDQPQAVVFKTPSRKRWGIRRLLYAFITILVVFGIALAGAEYYTSKPSFCGTCHIMVPYYESWQQDVHSDKVDAWCVDCHYAPGEQHTIKAKFKGLSQLMSYFSGRAGQARPRAHVKDASCLTAPCHGDNAYMDKPLLIGEIRREKRIIDGQETEVERQPTVSFVHSKHLPAKEVLVETQLRIEEADQRFKASVPEVVYTDLRRLAVSVDPMPDRQREMEAILAQAGLQNRQADALEILRLENLKTRQRQLVSLKCATCHFYDPSGKSHIVVDTQTCFTCHFTGQAFNRDTGACLTCHEPPTRMITVHEPTTTQPDGAAMMNHQEVVDRKIDCASCHLDVVRGIGKTTVRECGHCHDQESYLTAFESRTVQEVDEYHRFHVETQHARCTDCHVPAQHSLIEPVQVAAQTGFIQVVLDNCRHCHPDHHREQVDLLMGVSGEGMDRPMPNAMFGSRINCRACHIQAGSDFKGDPLIQATATTCVACHGEEYRSLLDRWIHEIAASLKESVELVDHLSERVERLRSEGLQVPERVQSLLAQASHNVHLIQVGNGIHNKNYSLNLLDVAKAAVHEAESLLPSQ